MDAFIRAKIEESRLNDLHPITGAVRRRLTPATTPIHLSSGPVSLSEVEAIEAEDFPIRRRMERRQSFNPHWSVRCRFVSTTCCFGILTTTKVVERQVGPRQQKWACRRASGQARCAGQNGGSMWRS